MKLRKQPKPLYCVFCGGRLRRGTLAYHMGCLIVLYNMLHKGDKGDERDGDGQQ